jgi:uncharacterized protein YcfJ
MIASTLLFSGCRSMNNTETGTVVGTGVGAGVGTAIGAATGHPGAGAIVGAAAGAITGGAIGNAEDKREQKVAIAQATYERNAAIAQAQAGARLGITDIVTLTQQGTDPDVIVNQIRSTGSTFTLSTADIQYLTQVNVSPKVIQAMQAARPGVVPQTVVIRDGGPVIVPAPVPAVIVERPYPYYWGYHRYYWR